MKPHDPLDALLARARSAGPREEAERAAYGFETRLSARLRPEPPAFGIWPWRLLPFFAILAVVLAWNTFSYTEERELALRSALEDGATEWTVVQAITGKIL